MESESDARYLSGASYLHMYTHHCWYSSSHGQYRYHGYNCHPHPPTIRHNYHPQCRWHPHPHMFNNWLIAPTSLFLLLLCHWVLVLCCWPVCHWLSAGPRRAKPQVKKQEIGTQRTRLQNFYQKVYSWYKCSHPPLLQLCWWVCTVHLLMFILSDCSPLCYLTTHGSWHGMDWIYTWHLVRFPNSDMTTSQVDRATRLTGSNRFFYINSLFILC